MVRCGVCGRVFEDGVAWCSFDGAALQPVSGNVVPGSTQAPIPLTPKARPATAPSPDQDPTHLAYRMPDPAPRPDAAAAPPPAPAAPPAWAPPPAPASAPTRPSAPGAAAATTDSGRFVPGETIAGRFVIRSELGRGGFGATFLCDDLTFKRAAVVKLLHARHADDPDARRRFDLEALALSRLDHRNIVKVFDRGTSGDGVPWFAMEYVQGRPVSSLLAGGPLPERDVCLLGTQLGDALQAAHARGFIHRDLKPDNLVLAADDEGRPLLKVLDFGIAAVSETAADSAVRDLRSVSLGNVVGTLQYMSPEQAHGERITPASDIYSAAVVLYHLLTGRLPADLPSQWSPLALESYISSKPVSIARVRPGANPRLVEVLGRALEKDPARRFQSGAELAEALRGVQAELEAPAARPKRRLAPLLALVALLALGGAGLAAWLALRPGSLAPAPVPPPPPPAPVVSAIAAPAPAPLAPAPGPAAAEMVFLAQAAVQLGCDGEGCPADATPSFVATVPAFWLDRDEVALADYAACVAAKGCTPTGSAPGCLVPAPGDRRPVNCVTWAQADAFCRWRKARLPGEQEWERAAGGITRRPWPWGPREPDCGRANFDAEGPGTGCGANAPAPAGGRPGGATPEGVQDLAGNVWEWTADWYDPRAWQSRRAPASGRERVVRGGSYLDGPAALRSVARGKFPPGGAFPAVGFRCARSQ